MTELVITRKHIDLDASPILYDRPITIFGYVEDWEVHNASWRYQDDALIGKNDKTEPGVIMNRKSFPGNVLVDFYGQTVLPSAQDADPAGITQTLKVRWNLSWDAAAQKPGVSYSAGLLIGASKDAVIEKSPENRLLANAPSPWIEHGRLYHIQAGSIDGHCFLFVNGELRLEVTDPDPINSSEHTHVGLEVCQSTVKISRVVVRQIVWRESPV